MQQHIERTFILTEEEVKVALCRYLREVHDRPMPADSSQLDVTLDRPEVFQITVEWADKIELTIP